MNVDVLGIARESLQRSFPLGAAIGLALAAAILIGWQAPLPALCGVLAPPLLALGMVPEVLARGRPRSLRRDAAVVMVAACGGVALAGAGFYQAGYAGYNLMYATGETSVNGQEWLGRALRRPNLRFGWLLATIALPLAVLTPLRLRGARLRTQWLALALLGGPPLALLCSSERYVQVTRGFGFPFVDTYHYAPLWIVVCALAPPLLAWGDRLFARWGARGRLLAPDEVEGHAEQGQAAADRRPGEPAEVVADSSAEGGEDELP